MPDRLTGPRTLELLREVVGERPDHVYERRTGTIACRYVYKGKPDCLVGHVLFRAGFPLASIDKFGVVALVFADILDTEAIEILSAAQLAQDEGAPWSEALEAAEAAYPHRRGGFDLSMEEGEDIVAWHTLRKQRDRLLELARWLVSLDEPGSEDRRTVTLNAIIKRAAALVGDETEADLR